MIQATDDYLADRIDLRDLVSTLEGSLDASGIKDECLTREFHDCWGPLEIEHAVSRVLGGPLDEDRVSKEAERMKSFLLRTLSQVEEYEPTDS
jgi:hypothetical protein